MDYRVQRLKEELTNAQYRNKNQRKQLDNYKKAYEKLKEENKLLKEIKKQLMTNEIPIVESIVLSQLYEDKESVPVSDVLDLLEYYYDEMLAWKYKYEELEENLRENYEPIPLAEQYGISDRDFI